MQDRREHFCVICGASNEADQGRCFACGRSLLTTQSLPSVASVPLLNGRYHLLEQVGQGGFSVVYKAEDTQTKRVVAMKATSLRGLSSQEQIDATDTFHREVRLLSQVSHAHLPRIYDHFSDTECWYLVMEFIDGITLETHLERDGKPPLLLEEVLDLGVQLCDVLAYLHDRQPAIIFRDLKPANIMLTRDGKLFLIDFGIARRFIPGKAKDTIPFGSPGYAAPEQYGRAQSSTRSDIYSLGAILHQLLSGNDPAQTPFTFAPLPGQDRSELRQLDRLIQQMVLLQSDQRPESLQTVKRELEQIALPHRQFRTNPLAPPIDPSSMSPLIWSQTSAPVSQTPSPQRKAFLTRPAIVPMLLVLGLLALGVYGGATSTGFWHGSTPTGTGVRHGSTATSSGSGSKLVHPKGSIWQAHSGTSEELRAVTWSGTQWVAVGTHNAILTSPDGDSWTSQTPRDSNDPSDSCSDWHVEESDLEGVAWSGTQFMAVGDNAIGNGPKSMILTSADGRTWTPQFPPFDEGLRAVAWSGTQWAAVGTPFVGLVGIQTSSDECDWTPRFHETSNNADGSSLGGIAWSGGQLVAVGNHGTILTFLDGQTWTSGRSGTSQDLRGITWSGTQFVAVGSHGTIVTSADGRAWTPRTSGTSNTLYGVAWSGSQFAVVGDNGTILISTDGRTWTPRTSGTSEGLRGVAWSGTQLVAVGTNGTILTS